MSLRYAHYYGEDMTGIPYVNAQIQYCKANRDILTEAVLSCRVVTSPGFGVIDDPRVMQTLAADYRARSLWWRRQKRRMVENGMVDPDDPRFKVTGY